MRYSFPKSHRLLQRRQFLRRTRPIKSYVGDCVIVEVRSSETPLTRLGITVTKRFGKATQRNRFKRIVREAFRLSLGKLPEGVDLLVKPRRLAKSAKMSNVATDLIDLTNAFICRSKLKKQG